MTDGRTYIWVDASPGEAILSSSTGEPVWPVRSERDGVALEGVARLFGGRLQSCRGEARRGHSLARAHESVVALGHDADGPAALYAHLTGRSYAGVVDAGSLASCAARVVVTLSHNASEELWEALYEREQNVAPGIIIAPSADELFRQVLLKSAALALAGAAPTRDVRVDIFPLVDLDRMAGDGWELLGQRASPEALRSGFTRSAGILTLWSHSDGLDAYVGSALTVCPVGQPASDWAADSSPSCWNLGRCVRHDMLPIAEAARFHISPEQISARMLVWNVCFGVLTPGSAIDPGWSTMSRLLENPAVGAVFFTWDMTTHTFNSADALPTDLARGVSAGVALARGNASAEALEYKVYMGLFGDPDLRLPFDANGQSNPVPSDPTPVRPEVVPSDVTARGDEISVASTIQTFGLSELTLMRACLELEPRRPYDQVPMAADALEALRQFERARWLDLPTEGTPDAPGPRMRELLLDYLCGCGRIQSRWGGFQLDEVPEIQHRPCFVCGRRARAMISRVRLSGVSPRRTVICPRCQLVEDAPVASTLTLRLQGGEFQLEGAFPRGVTVAALHLWSHLPTNGRSWRWPREHDGRLSRAFRPPEPWMPGGHQVTFSMVADTAVILLSLRAQFSLPLAPRLNGKSIHRSVEES